MSGRLGHRRVWLAVMAVSLWLQSTPATPAPSPPPVPPPAGADDASRAWMFRRLAEADQLLRRGRPRAAARAFREVFVNAEGTQWGGLAELGLAWSVAAGGDLDMARALAADARASSGITASASSVVFGLLSARAGDHAAALEQLDVAARSASQPSEANVIGLTRAYVLFWSGAFAGAAGEFDVVGNADRGGGLADDARYGAAWSRWKAGDGARAMSELNDLVRDAPPDFQFRSVPRRLVELDERAILGDSTRRYRRGGIQAPDAQLARLLDSDGYSRARSALRILDSERDQAARSESGIEAGDAIATDPSLANTGPQDHRAHGEAMPAPGAVARSSAGSTPSPTSRPVFAVVMVLLGLVALGVGVALARRQRAGALPKQR